MGFRIGNMHYLLDVGWDMVQHGTYFLHMNVIPAHAHMSYPTRSPPHAVRHAHRSTAAYNAIAVTRYRRIHWLANIPTIAVLGRRRALRSSSGAAYFRIVTPPPPTGILLVYMAGACLRFRRPVDGCGPPRLCLRLRDLRMQCWRLPYLLSRATTAGLPTYGLHPWAAAPAA